MASDNAIIDASTVAATFCSTLVDEFVRAGITDAVIAPGSRSTPIVLALSADSRIAVHVHHDERAAGFVALGFGLAARRPAIVVTTSGTAAVELHPAVVEAHHSNVALLAITADRPPESQGVGAPQTIDQTHLFGAAVRAFHAPGVPSIETRDSWRSIAARAVLDAQGSPPGPVHLNLAFREPLIGQPVNVPPGRDNGAPWHGRPAARAEPNALDPGALADAFKGRRGLIVAGGGIDRPESVHSLAGALRWPVLADPRSGCRLPLTATICHFDAILRGRRNADSLNPEVVLRLGSPPASKALREWLADSDSWQIAVERDGQRFDPDNSLSALLTSEPGAFCAGLLDEIQAGRGAAQAEAEWFDRWVGYDAEAASAVARVLASRGELNEPAIARDVVAALPAGGYLMVSSSMPIRDVEWFSAPREGLTIHANRGANGIDGVVSSAMGIALATGAPTAVLVGDIAFLHDANALLGSRSRGVDLVVIVVDNDGGGIFSFLPQAKALEGGQFEKLFGTPHGVDPGAVAAAFGANVVRIKRQADLPEAVSAAATKGGVHAIVLKTQRDTNVAIHEEIHNAVVNALPGHA